MTPRDVDDFSFLKSVAIDLIGFASNFEVGSVQF
jgi:hypothetical protein